jgi:DNA-binding XRE family transcriptional regulator
MQAMDSLKRQRLEAAGWKIGSVAEFLELSPQEAALVELKLALSRRLRESRLEHHLSQAQLARRMNSSQSRIAKMEAGDPSVSADLLIRGLLSTGATCQDIADVIASTEVGSAAST